MHFAGVKELVGLRPLHRHNKKMKMKRSMMTGVSDILDVYLDGEKAGLVNRLRQHISNKYSTVKIFKTLLCIKTMLHAKFSHEKAYKCHDYDV
jgi:hypothetical protein